MSVNALAGQKAMLSAEQMLRTRNKLVNLSDKLTKSLGRNAAGLHLQTMIEAEPVGRFNLKCDFGPIPTELFILSVYRGI